MCHEQLWLFDSKRNILHILVFLLIDTPLVEGTSTCKYNSNSTLKIEAWPSPFSLPIISGENHLMSWRGPFNKLVVAVQPQVQTWSTTSHVLI